MSAASVIPDGSVSNTDAEAAAAASAAAAATAAAAAAAAAASKDAVGASGSGSVAAVMQPDVKAFNDLKYEFEALKKMGCESRKNAELEKHKKPQIKRAIGFIMDVNFCLEDVEKNASKIVECHNEGKPIDIVSLCDLLNNIKSMKDILSNELLMNKIASSSIGGFRTVKHYETPDVFKDLDVSDSDLEKLSSKLRSAEFKAKQDYNRFKASKGKPSGAIMKKNEFASNSHSDKLLNVICFKCNTPGHFKKNCPKN